MCTLTSVVRSQHSIGQTRLQRKGSVYIPRTSINEYNKAFRASWCVHSTHGVCVLQNTLVVCLFVCVFVDTKTSSLSETGQFMSSTYYVPVRNRKILASTYLTNESVRQGAEKSRLKIFFALLKLLFNIVDPCQKNDYYQSGRS